ncbi:hypothetical protein V1290_000362 [Bradyrhizobium sp. AZCC 1578]|uniref:hypothetical protein n=1 Tax=Bradyrhizobium sp. AZCC 1578 TaxID=3117027 RepID=UPI002FF0E034
MADLGSYTFVPWLRRGMATAITRDEGVAPPPGSGVARIALSVSITLNETITPPPVDLALFGPGDVTGVDRDAIIRVAPTPDTFDVEPNYFPLIEFDQADFPWRYTPARASSADRLTPWIALVVLRDDEIKEVREPAHAGSLPLLFVDDAAVLPSLAQTWAWAHAQISGGKNLGAAEIASVIAADPARAISRLLCPRRLEPLTAYTAFLVPTFERGRRAGGGEPAPVDLDALQLAWTDSGPVTLPIYHRWRFGTGAAGDFEFLVRQLEARVLPKTIGRRDLDVSTPGDQLPAAFDRAVGLEGALRAIGMERTDWSGSVQQSFVARLAALLNLPADRLEQPGADRAVVPPLYGCWHAKSDRVRPASEPIWFNDLNQDPRERVAAGIGARVIQTQQRQLMAGAWAQVDGIREANQRLRYTQLARELALRIYRRHIPANRPDEVLQLSAPLLSRVVASPITIQARLAASPILPGTLESQFRRVLRPRGPVGRRQGRTGAPWTGFDRMNRGELKGPGPALTSPNVVTTTSAPPTRPPWDTPGNIVRLRRRAERLPWIGLALVIVGLLLWPAAGTVSAIAGLAAGAVAVVAARQARQQVDASARLDALTAGSLTPAQLDAVEPPPSFAPVEIPAGRLEPPPGSIARAGGAEAFRTAARELATQLTDRAADVPELKAVKLPELGAKVMAAIDPKVSVVAGLRDRMKLPGGVRQPTADPAETVMAAPTFPQPMYAPLAAVSQDWILPGIKDVLPNTVTTVLTNQRFIEAYMVGLNHEMARELQWNEYPTDMRGSYFRQFWDPAGGDAAPGAELDITALDTWDRTSALGQHSVRVPPPGGEHLVLVIRGEVFRRYPNTQVYAVKAKAASGGTHDLTDTELLPAFGGRLAPDVAFFGFDLTAADARGDETAGSVNQGWFFVLQEHPSEPHFGLDVPDVVGGRPARWSDLSWGHLATTDGELKAIRNIDLAAALPDTTQVNPTGGAKWHLQEGARAADLAYITLQPPMRVAVHGSDMIPPQA